MVRGRRAQARDVGAAPEGRAPHVKVPRDTHSRVDGVAVRFEEARGRAPKEQAMRVTVRGLERPIFAYSYQVADNRAATATASSRRASR